MPGPPKKPAALKVISGTNQPCRAAPPPAVELPAVIVVPAPPKWLKNKHAVDEWKRLAPILTANKLLTEGGLSAFGHMCALHGAVIQLWMANETPTASMISTLQSMINDFGLTPVAQGKVKPNGGEEKKGNKFAGNGKRPGAA
jgi:phage terminase small subunit